MWAVSAVAVSSHYLFALGYLSSKEAEGAPCALGIGHWANAVTYLSRTLFVGKQGLEQAKQAIISYKTGQIKEMTPDIWHAKKIVDSTLHPGTQIER